MKEKKKSKLNFNLDLKKSSLIRPEDVMKYLDTFIPMDYSNYAKIKVLFQAFLKAIIITDSDEVTIICNNDSKNKKTNPSM